MIRIKEAIIVEGTYDKIKLDQMVDATIIITGGFSIFKDNGKIGLIKRLAEKVGIVVLTDSDRAGFMIRNYIKQCIPAEYVKHAYIPEVKGVEKRKTTPGKEGLLGVEGVKNALIQEALENAGCIIEAGDMDQGGMLISNSISTNTITNINNDTNNASDNNIDRNTNTNTNTNNTNNTNSQRKITKVDFYNDGLIGRENSSNMRKQLTVKLNLPSRLSTNALLDVLNTLYGYDRYKEIVDKSTPPNLKG